MSDRLDDPLDPFERRLADHVRSYSDHGVVPVDAAAIAHSVTSRRRSVAASPFRGAGWLLIGALLAAIAIGTLALSGGGPTLPAPSASASAIAAASPSASASASASASPSPSPSPTSSPSPSPSPSSRPAITACQATDLSARITAWTGAAGHRIADVELTNDGPACDLATVQQPQLVDGAGTVLIDGDPPTSADTLRVAPGAKLTTEVQDDNYCGPTPEAPVTIGFVLYGGTRLDADPFSASDLMGVPPCNGPTLPGDIEMQPWKP